MSFSPGKCCFHDGNKEHVPSVCGLGRTQRPIAFLLVAERRPVEGSS